MNNLEYMWNLKSVDITIKTIESFFIIFFTFFCYIKIMDFGKIRKRDIVLLAVCSCIIALSFRIIGYCVDIYLSWLVLILLITIVNIIKYKQSLSYCFVITIISLSICYAIYMIALALGFFPYAILKIQNDYIGLFIIIFVYIIMFLVVLRNRKIKHGIVFLHKKINNAYFCTSILNISIIALFLIVIIQKDVNNGTKKVWVNFIIVLIIMFVNMKQFFDTYYKQNLLTKDLEETKIELEQKRKELEKLEKENLEFSKTSHSLAHKQKALEFKIDRLLNNENMECDKTAIREEIESVSKEVFREPERTEIKKTEIESLDNMLLYMQSECIKNNIKFELQVIGNIYYMVNNLISENDLEILIADHIIDAIIAINDSNNENRSILVRIGKIDEIYSIYIYDSGIEFEEEILNNLGKKPVTSHKDSGGTGMGFMNTFETLYKTKASLLIKEIGKPCIDNYTKVLVFKFDNQNEYKIETYKEKLTI